MLRRRCASLAIGAVLVVSAPSAAQDLDCSRLQHRSYSILFENDVNWLAVLGQADDEYTAGVRLNGVLRHYPSDWRVPLDFWSLQYGKPTTDTHCFVGDWSAGLSIYTPEDTATSDFIANDRPYAGWLYVSYNRHAFGFSGDNLTNVRTFEVSVGLVGPWAGGEDFQNGAHEAFNIRRPDGSIKSANGWAHQLRKEIGVMLSYRTRHRLVEAYFSAIPSTPKNRYADAVADSEVTVGNVFNHVGAGITSRFGLNLSEDLGPVEGPRSSRKQISQIPPLPPQPINFSKWPEMFGFLRIGTRGVIRNLFLDQSFFHDKTHAIETEPAVFEFEGGAVVRLGYFRITWRTVARTAEFRRKGTFTAVDKPRQRFGSLTITLGGRY